MTCFPLLLLLLCAVGCAGGPEHLGNAAALAISPDSTPEQVELVIASAHEWHVATSGRVDLQLRIGQPDGDASIRFESLGGEPGAGDQHVGLTLIGVGHEPDITVDPRTTYMQKTIMHELGHAFGLEAHEQGTLMQSGGVVPPVVDARTLARWEALQ